MIYSYRLYSLLITMLLSEAEDGRWVLGTGLMSPTKRTLLKLCLEWLECHLLHFFSCLSDRYKWFDIARYLNKYTLSMNIKFICTRYRTWHFYPFLKLIWNKYYTTETRNVYLTTYMSLILLICIHIKCINNLFMKNWKTKNTTLSEKFQNPIEKS